LKINKFPSVFNAITYFNKSTFSQRFFDTTKTIFQYWNDFKSEFNLNGESNTDTVYSLASYIMGEDKTTDLLLSDISMVHMKPKINNTYLDNWTNELQYEIVKDVKNIIRIDNHTQIYPVHYYVKDFSQCINKELYE
jgi:hypothetical protein